MDRTYKGYMISKSLNGNYWVMKDGKCVAKSSTIRSAKDAINMIIDAQ